MNLNEIDTWTPDMYYNYYQNLIPFYEKWYNAKDGYRAVAIGRNIPWWIEKGETVRNCYIKKHKTCKNMTDDCNMILQQFGSDKLSCWECSITSDKKKRALISPWERFYDSFEKILWDIESIKNSKVLKTCRTMYWHNSIRDDKLKYIRTDKSWNEIIGSNFTLDIDIKNKNKNDIFDIWNDVSPMINTLTNKLESDDIEYKIMNSGNGIYFITKRIIYDIDKEENESREVFWNKVTHGWRKYIKDELIPLFDKHPNFNVDGEEPYTMKFYKSPFSIHQRLDVSAIPLSIDMINDITTKDLKEITDPLYISDNWKKLSEVWN